jgi:hypothetical protein
MTESVKAILHSRERCCARRKHGGIEYGTMIVHISSHQNRMSRVQLHKPLYFRGDTNEDRECSDISLYNICE